MSSPERLRELALSILDANTYVVLGTAGADGAPWVSPVWFAAAGPRELFWVSSPETRHSRNIAERPEVSAAIFDSRQPIGTGEGLYVQGVAAQVTGPDLEHGLEVFSTEAVAQGGRRWTSEDVTGSALHRLYRLRAETHWVLDPDGNPAHGGRLDFRVKVEL